MPFKGYGFMLPSRYYLYDAYKPSRDAEDILMHLEPYGLDIYLLTWLTTYGLYIDPMTIGFNDFNDTVISVIDECYGLPEFHGSVILIDDLLYKAFNLREELIAYYSPFIHAIIGNETYMGLPPERSKSFKFCNEQIPNTVIITID